MAALSLTAPGWRRSGSTSARGYASREGGGALGAADIAALLDRSATEMDWRAVAASLNGCFAAVTQRPGLTLAAVDRVRTIPLFWAIEGRDAYLSDDAYWVSEQSAHRAMNPLAGQEFLLTGYVTGSETLVTGVSQVRAGHFLRIIDDRNSPHAEQLRYYRFTHGHFARESDTAAIARLEQVHERVFRCLLASAAGRTLVVPLSGGYDSRLIGVSLRDLGARDVVCYTYGVPGNWESRISEELARYLGFRWLFVPYSAERWRAWSTTDAFKCYFRAAGNLTSVPHLQDWPAVFELTEQRLIPADGIFVPGHTGDFLTGGHVPRGFAGRSQVSRRTVLDAIERAHYSLWDWPGDDRRSLREAFDRRIERVAETVADGSGEDAADAYEAWELEERQAKFICNSVRVYESFGYEWRLPLYDHDLMDFWARIPLARRIGRTLFYEFVKLRQNIPVTPANRDHGAAARIAIAAIQRMGFKDRAKRVQRTMRRMRWQREYDGSPLAWYALIDRDDFGSTYTGRQNLHAYMARRYLAEITESGPNSEAWTGRMSGDRRPGTPNLHEVRSAH